MLSVDIEKNYPGFRLQSTLEVADNQLLVILGPSGSGKSLTLQSIAGLIKPDRGKIILQNSVFFDQDKGINLTTQERKVGYIFQNYALFPHLSVVENIGYGLRRLKVQQRKEIVDELVELLRLKGHENKYPSQISGGQQQRVAIARALAVKPRILLLDEPFSALDNIIRHKIRTDVLRLKEKLNIPMILVTHDLEEAYTLGDRLIVMEQGNILQEGVPQEIFSNPKTIQVAKFVGMRNIFQGHIVTHDNSKLTSVVHWKDKYIITGYIDKEIGAKIALGIRPEEVMLIREHKELGQSVKENVIECSIVRIIPEGLHYRLYLRFSDDSYDLEMLLPRHVFYKIDIRETDLIKISLKTNSIKYLLS